MKLKNIFLSIRFKIISGIIVIILASYIVLAFITGEYIRNIFVKEIQNQVRLDINSADEIYEDHIEHLSQILHAISIRRETHASLEEELKGGLDEVFKKIYQKNKMDILTFADTNGNVIFRAHNPAFKGDNILEISIIKKAIQEWSSVEGTVVFEKEQLKNESEDLYKRAEIKIKSTPKSRNIQKTTENRGLLIAAAVPITSLYNKKKGIVFGAYLLNNNFDIVDEIKDKLFQHKEYQGKDIGTSTIFLEDVRVSTNVKHTDNTRAVGSLLSTEVYNHVFQKGEFWDARAFVVNDWYITAYKPIKDIEGNIIGVLYVGLLEKPFNLPQKTITIFFIIALSITALAIFILMFFYTRMTMKSIEEVIHTSKKIMNGDLSARCSINASDEAGLLCKTINQMAESLERHEKKLKEDTQMQISQSEKLASVGRLAAGVAHEINNPLTGVLTFAHLLKEKKTNNESDLQDIDVIIHETTRVREIIRGLLDFARQSPSIKEMNDINEIIQQLLLLLKGQKEFRNIKIIENYDKNLPEIFADKNQLQQVFMNLFLNAGEAIFGTGAITITTSISDSNILITISDTGCGIKDVDMDKIFDPFFTTKPVGKGTGLGLSVSHGIIQQHGGSIKCESKEGEGTIFKIFLPYPTNYE